MENTHNNPWLQFQRRPAIAPSLLACNYMKLGEQIHTVEAAGAQMLHVDVMDGHFVPNLALSPAIVKSVRGGSDRLLDVHLMVTDPLFFCEPFVKAGASSITFHVEADSDPQAVIDKLRQLGVGVGIVVKPKTDVKAIAPYAGLVDLVLIMTVEPGFGGQSFMTDQVEKVRRVRDMVGPDVRVEVDGGINERTGAVCVAAGADTLVAGVDIFHAADIAAAFKGLQGAAERAAAQRGSR